ncbi:hypothetical protein AWM75_04025 [Aerococcus urinaehominis]|uniref:DNA polymerase III subunit delta n=1 Tax=Aerococcus urinaehominis TaxID=128944 RepID=A0A0X8FKY5_9LACT|nr:DNA polymerase III subunit delta' [Aerococcus urinaehominis]AMB99224.1 hypothetical protein AWM75_04025 [Aerococcus urinaehominis]SDM31861.1 DNA polymerase-3 subunit delta' [Aerococcus urinaehominis]
MSFAITEKQPRLTQLMTQVVCANRLGHAYLLAGQAGAGPADMALYLSCALFCQQAQSGQPCGHCQHCQRIIKEEFPDVTRIRPDGQSIKIDQVRAVKQDLAMSGLEGSQQVFIFYEAEKLTSGAANALLKFLEEPHNGVYFFLLTKQTDQVLATIQSRCQLVYFPSLAGNQAITHFKDQGLNDSTARLMVNLTKDITSAQELLADEVFTKQVDLILAWLARLFSQDARAFTMVASDWMKISKDRPANMRLLQTVLVYLYDLFYLACQGEASQDEQIYLPHNKVTYAKILAHTNKEAVNQAIEALHQAVMMLAANVPVQASLEYFVLATWLKDDV